MGSGLFFGDSSDSPSASPPPSSAPTRHQMNQTDQSDSPDESLIPSPPVPDPAPPAASPLPDSPDRPLPAEAAAIEIEVVETRPLRVDMGVNASPGLEIEGEDASAATAGAGVDVAVQVSLETENGDDDGNGDFDLDEDLDFIELRPGQVPINVEFDSLSDDDEEDDAVDPNRIGCKHYPRNCEILAPCCSKWFTCRLCHNEEMESSIVTSIADLEAQHQVDRYAISRIRCLICGIEQGVSNCCTGCGIQFASYFCEVCRLWDGTPDKAIYHCQECGLCRIGLREQTVHCSTCCMCFDKDSKHTCREGALQEQCPVCLNDMFTSRQSIRINKCGHHLHFKCFQKMCESSNVRCPICSKDMIDLSSSYSWMETALSEMEIPEEYREMTIQILCNNCLARSEIPFHFYLKCPECRSFNCKRL